MAIVNHAKREINAKIVYYGPQQSGKSTLLRFIYDHIKPSLRGEFKSLPASGATLLFFDFSPFEQTQHDGYRIRLHIYTLQGPVSNPAAWKMTLKGADGLVLVMDSAPDMLESNRQSLQELRAYLNGYGTALQDTPYVLQANKADVCQDSDIINMSAGLGLSGCCTVETNALSGKGVLEGLTQLSSLILSRIRESEDHTTAAEVNAAHAEAGVPAALPCCDGHTTEMAFSSAASAAAEPQDETAATGITVKVDSDTVQMDGQTVNIPLDIQTPSGRQSIVVTVTVSARPAAS